MTKSSWTLILQRRSALKHFGLMLLTVFAACSPLNFEGEDALNADATSLLNATSFALTPAGSIACGSAEYNLWAGQTHNAGTLIVSNDDTNLYVTYNSNGEVGDFGTLHLWVGTDLTLVPSTGNGTPIPGKFPYHYDTNGEASHTFTIPLNEIPSLNGACDTEINVVAHAEVGEETAFGGNMPVNVGTPGRWWYYAAYMVACCQDQPPVPSSKLGTAFAKGGYVFTTDKKSNPEKLPSLMLTKNRWGWAINVASEGSTTYDLWVGAGLNNTSKGLLVGSVTVDYSGGQATVTYNYNSGYSMEEAHIYTGDFKPTTLAPGQYGHTVYFDPYATTYSATFDVSDSNGDGIWVIAHAVAYGANVTNP